MAELIEDINGILSKEKDGLHVDQITDRLILLGQLAGIDRGAATKKVNSLLSRKAKDKKSRIIHVKNKQGGNKRGCYRLKRIPPPPPSPGPVLIKPYCSKSGTLFPDISSTMLGKAGEYAVVSRLLLNGYIANIMSVDDGIDIIASQDQNVFFVQVKTATVDQRMRCKFSVKKSAFQKGHLLQVRYILVARYDDNKMLFIRFTEDDIKRLKDFISAENSTINLNVKFENNEAYIYRGDKQEKLEYHLNNFDL